MSEAFHSSYMKQAEDKMIKKIDEKNKIIILSIKDVETKEQKKLTREQKDSIEVISK